MFGEFSKRDIRFGRSWSGVNLRILHWVNGFTRWSQAQIDKSWFPYLLLFCAFIDMWLVVIPTDALVIAATLAHPRIWKRLALAFVIGSTLGGASLSWLSQNYGFEILNYFFADIQSSPAWLWAEAQMDRFGLLTVFLVAATPFSQQPFIILASMAHNSVLSVTGAQFCGRAIKYLILGWLCSHSPKAAEWLEKKTRIKLSFPK